MTICEFGETIKNLVSKELGDDFTIRLDNVIKNNDNTLTGLTIITKDCNISPTIYLNEYYDRYVSEKISFDEITSDVIEVYQSNAVNKNVDFKWFLDFDNVKGRIIYALINTERNAEFLKDVPSIPFMNLSIIFKVLVDVKDTGRATITIHNQHCAMWEVDKADLMECAKRNAERISPTRIENIVSCFNWPFDFDLPMYVIRNELYLYGASAILDKKSLKTFAESLDSNLYLLPSSTEEFIAIPDCDIKESVEQLRMMVMEINREEVRPEEVLSNDVYYYNLKEDKIVML